MKMLKLEIKNFRPYYSNQDDIIINLFDKSRKNRNISLNVGPNGNGKTSISYAILWCLYGPQYNENNKDWGSMVNTLAIDVAKSIAEKKVEMKVALEIELDGHIYRIVRNGQYDIVNNQKDDEISITRDGNAIKDPQEFINDHFPPVHLMKYFIFDADKMLKAFESEQEKTIADHINEIVGVKLLDNMYQALRDIDDLYDQEIHTILSKIPSTNDQEFNTKTQEKQRKELAISQLRGKIDNYKRDRKMLFPKGQLTAENRRLKELMDQQEQAEKAMDDLNKKFEALGVNGKLLISDLYLVFLKEILHKSIGSLNRAVTTKDEFSSAISILRSTMGDKYCGIFIDDGKELLLKKNVKIKNQHLVEAEKLKLGSGSGIKVLALPELQEKQESASKVSISFFDLKRQFDSAKRKRDQAKGQIKQLGQSDKNKALKEKIEKFLEYDSKIQAAQKTINETESVLVEINQRLSVLEQERAEAAEDREAIDHVKNKRRQLESLLKVVIRTRERFLQDLLDEVNGTASEFLRQVVKTEEQERFYSISIDKDYKLNVITKNGKVIDPSQINESYTQLTLMAFFFGLSKYLKNPIPYVIDDPLIRLDPGHDKRLIEQLSKNNQQIIMNLIPGREYVEENFEWLKPYINIQNWIHKVQAKGQPSGVTRSYAEIREYDKYMKYDLKKL